MIAGASAMALAILTLAGCATTVPVAPPTPVLDADAVSAAGERGWWRVEFRVAWDREAEPAWHVDALLADQVVAPVLARHAGALALWRFHRRAADDEAGHRFSFVFYADRASAAAIRAEIGVSEVLAALRGAGTVERVGLPDPDAALEREVAATSDRAWPREIQRSWPWLIMGASRYWLALVDEIRRELDPLPERAAVDDLLEHYRLVDAIVTGMWRDFGQHAVFHHLSGIFGYRPLIIQERMLKRY